MLSKPSDGLFKKQSINGVYSPNFKTARYLIKQSLAVINENVLVARQNYNHLLKILLIRTSTGNVPMHIMYLLRLAFPTQIA